VPVAPRYVATAFALVWRFITAPFRRSGSPSARALEPWARPEFPRVNSLAGSVPLSPELSGLEIRPVSFPQRVTRLLIQIGYRWVPSESHGRRQEEIRAMNCHLQRYPREHSLPPILTFPADTEVSPTRVQPFLERSDRGGPLSSRGDVHDLTDLEEMERLRNARVLRVRLPETDSQYLVTYRPLLPRQYREFLRTSPYPRLVALCAAGVLSVGGWLWFSQTQKAEAVAARRYHVARRAFRSELSSALAYGVDPAALQPLESQSVSLQSLAAPSGLIAGQARAGFYREQAVQYRVMQRAVRRLERRALRYWRWRERTTQTALVRLTAEARRLGLPASAVHRFTCATPRCHRRMATAMAERIRQIRPSIVRLRIYNRQIATAADPASETNAFIREARNLGTLTPALPPVLPARLDALDGVAQTGADLARAGALAHLDVDVFHAALLRSLPTQAIVVSLHDQTLTVYQSGKAIRVAQVAAGSQTPAGAFHIRAKQPSVPTVFWRRNGRGYSYRYGTIPDWMPFSGGAALQAAPWRASFGAGAVTGYAPNTPGSIDLRPSAARFVFAWAPVGTQVVVY
jgi:hypothetical protein